MFFQEAPDQLRAVDEGDWETPQALIEQELAICGLTHPEVGAMACSKWGLPKVIERVVRQHHDPLPERLRYRDEKVVAIVRLADLSMFPSAMPGTESLDQSLDADELAAYLEAGMPSFLSLTGSQLAQIVGQAGAEADQASRALGITDG